MTNALISTLRRGALTSGFFRSIQTFLLIKWCLHYDTSLSYMYGVHVHVWRSL